MTGVDGVVATGSAWAALAVAAYLAVGLLAATLVQRRATFHRCGERLLLLYPRFARSALRTVVVTALGVGVAAPTPSAFATTPARGGPPRPPLVAAARPATEPLDWPVAVRTVPVHAPPSPPRAAAGEVTVQPGDSLWSLAAAAIGPTATAAEVAAAWPKWWAANRAVVGADPDLLRPGAVLHAPTTIERSAS